jgi:hypothetical protein
LRPPRALKCLLMEEDRKPSVHRQTDEAEGTDSQTQILLGRLASRSSVIGIAAILFHNPITMRPKREKH